MKDFIKFLLVMSASVAAVVLLLQLEKSSPVILWVIVAFISLVFGILLLLTVGNFIRKAIRAWMRDIDFDNPEDRAIARRQLKKYKDPEDKE